MEKNHYKEALPHRIRYGSLLRTFLLHRIVQIGVGVLFIVTLSFLVNIQAPSLFPVREIVTVEEGSNATDIASHLQKERIIQSPFLFTLLLSLFQRDNAIVAGDYYFHTKANALKVISMLTQGDYGLLPERVTIPEGTSVVDMVPIFERKFNYFNRTDFFELTEGKEGYLFPDTYLFLPTAKTKEIVRALEANFDKKLETIQSELEQFGKPIHEVVIMASLLEKEAHDLLTRRMIAGILWKRIAIGMPLQVDATFLYINGKNTFELTYDDLEVDSLYNTYKYAGLPAGPIGNPGLESLIAAITPIASDYLYYLSDRNGTTHYAATFEGHKDNKFRYLR